MSSSSPAAADDRFRAIESVAQRLYATIDTLWPEDLTVPGLKANVGLGVTYSPRYLGGDHYDMGVVPVVRLQYKDRIFFSGTTLRVPFYQDDHVRAGVLASYSSGRSPKDDPVLTGLDKISATVEAGPYIEYRGKHYRFGSELRQTFASHGLEGRFFATLGVYKDENWAVQSSGAVKWATGKRIRTYFGITPEEAARSPLSLPAYRPGSGLYEASISLGGQYKINERWSIVQMIEYSRLLDDAADSPLVEQGSANQFLGGAGIVFSF